MTDVNLYLKKFHLNRIHDVDDEDKKKSAPEKQKERENEVQTEPGSVGSNNREGSLFALEQAAMLATVGTSLSQAAATDIKEYNIYGIRFTVTNNTDDAGFLYKMEDDKKLVLIGSNCTINIEKNNPEIEIELQGNDVILNSNVKVSSITNYAIRATINGSDDDDIIINHAGTAAINGNNGNDIITNYGINTTINGGDGADIITSKSANTNIFGNNGKDNIFAIGYNSTIDSGTGNDDIYASGTQFGITASTGNNNIKVNASDTRITSGTTTKNDINVAGNNNNITNTNVDDKIVNNGTLVQYGNIGTDRPSGTDAGGRKLNANGELLTGLSATDGKMYENGTLLTGISKTDNQLYENGTIDTDRKVVDIYLYENGTRVSGIAVEQELTYYNGIIANGYVGNEYYIDGVKAKPEERGLHIIDGKLYDGDEIAKGLREYRSSIYYNGNLAQGVIEGNCYLNGYKLSTVEEQEYCTSIFAKANLDHEYPFGDIVRDKNDNIIGFKELNVIPPVYSGSAHIDIKNIYSLNYDNENNLTDLNFSTNASAGAVQHEYNYKFNGTDNYLGNIDIFNQALTYFKGGAISKDATGKEIYNINITKENQITELSDVSLTSATINFQNGKTIVVNENTTVKSDDNNNSIHCEHKNSDGLVESSNLYGSDGNFIEKTEYTYEAEKLISSKRTFADNSYCDTLYNPNGTIKSEAFYNSTGSFVKRCEYIYHDTDCVDIKTTYPDRNYDIQINNRDGSSNLSKYSADGKIKEYQEWNSAKNIILNKRYDNNERLNYLDKYTYSGGTLVSRTIQNDFSYNINKIESFTEQVIVEEPKSTTTYQISNVVYDEAQNIVLYKKENTSTGSFRYYTDAIPTDIKNIKEPVFKDGVLADHVTINGKTYYKGIQEGGALPKDYNGFFPDDNGFMYEKGEILTGISSVDQKLYESGKCSTGIKEWDSHLYINGTKDTADNRIYENKLYEKGDLSTTPIKDYNNQLFINGIRATDTNHEYNNKIYQNGYLDTAAETEYNNHLYHSGIKSTSDKEISTSGKLYEKGNLSTAPEAEYNNQLFINGVRATDANHEYNNKIYQNGYLDTAAETEYNNHLYHSGIKSTTDMELSKSDKLYEKGNLSNGYKEYGEGANKKLYKNGSVDKSGGYYKTTDTNTLYLNGLLFNGQYEADKLWYSNGKPIDGDVREGNTTKTYAHGVLVKSDTVDSSKNTRNIIYYYDNDINKYLSNALYNNTSNQLISFREYTYDASGNVTKEVYQYNFNIIGGNIHDFAESVNDATGNHNYTVTMINNNVDGNTLYTKSDGDNTKYYKIANPVSIPTPTTNNPQSVFKTGALFNGDYNNKYYQNGSLYTGTRIFDDGAIGTYNEGILIKKSEKVGTNTKITFYENFKEKGDVTFVGSSSNISEINIYSYVGSTKTTVITQNDFVYNLGVLKSFKETTSAGTSNIILEETYIDGSTGKTKQLYSKTNGTDKLFYTDNLPKIPALTDDNITAIFPTGVLANGTINEISYVQGVKSPLKAWQKEFLEKVCTLTGEHSFDDIDLSSVKFDSKYYQVTFSWKNSTIINEAVYTGTYTILDEKTPYNLRVKYSEWIDSTSELIESYTVDNEYYEYMEYLNSLPYDGLEQYIDMSLLTQTSDYYTSVDFKLDNDIKSDIDNIIREADNRVKADPTLTFGNVVSDLMVKNYKTTTKSAVEIFTDTQIGDVMEISGVSGLADGLYVHDRTSLVKLNMTKDDYLKLFPPISRYTATQFDVGDCYFVSGILLGCLENKTSYAEILKMFNINPTTKNVTITFNGPCYGFDNKGYEYVIGMMSECPVTFPAGNLFNTNKYKNPKTDSDASEYYVSGSLGLQMLEQAYAIAQFAIASETPITTLDVDAAYDFIDGGRSCLAQNSILGEYTATDQYLVNYESYNTTVIKGINDLSTDALKYYSALNNYYNEVDLLSDLYLYLFYDDEWLIVTEDISAFAYDVNSDKNIWEYCLVNGVVDVSKIEESLGDYAELLADELEYISENPEKFQYTANILKNHPEYQEIVYNYINDYYYSDYCSKLYNDVIKDDALYFAAEKPYNIEQIIADIETFGLYQALINDRNGMITDYALANEAGNAILSLSTNSYFPDDYETYIKFLAYGHAYFVDSIDDVNKTITIINPWNGALNVVITYADMAKYFSRIDMADMTIFDIA